MSGTTFLEEIVNWDDEKRAERVEEALPRLIICFENHHSYDEAIGILQILCQSFVPIVQQDQLEDKVFSKLSHQVCELLDGVIEELHEAATGQETDCDHLLGLLQHVASMLQCVEECMKHVARLTDLNVCHVRSLMTCSFHVLKGSYTHCRESSSLYGDSLPLFSNSLSHLFKTAHSVQMTLLNLVDKVTAAHTDTEHEVKDITQVCTSLFALCRVVACLDLKLTISLWKALSKLAGQQPGVLYHQIDMSGIVCYLCEEINTGVNHLLQSAPPANDQDNVMLSQTDEKVFMKSLKILSFQLKVLVALVRDFHDYFSDCVANICKLLLYLNSVVGPSLSAARLQEKHESEVRQQLCSAVQPIVSHLLNNTSFTHCVLKEDEKSECGRLMLQVMVMDGVAQASVDVMAQWIDTSAQSLDSRPCPSLLSAVIACLSRCHVEVCLPVYLQQSACEGQQDRTLSLYQFVVEHLCAFIASCPAMLFHDIEQELLQAVLSENPISSQAGADCWCFMARYGSADLCWHHTQLLISLLLRVNSQGPLSSACTPLISLLCRLLKFLSPQHQRSLASFLPAASQQSVWAEVSLSVLSSETAGEVSQVLLPPCLQSLKDFCQSPGPSLAQTAHVIPAIRCLHNIVQNDGAAHCLTPPQQALLLDLLSAMWKMIPSDHSFSGFSSTEDAVLLRYLSILMSLTSHFVDQLQVKVLLQVLLTSHKLLTSTSRDVTVAVLHLLQSLGRLKLQPSFEQGQILRKIGDTFAVGLSHQVALMQYTALEAFTRFAEQTVYEAEIPECLAQQDGLQDKVAAFLQKVPNPDGGQFDAVCYLQEQGQQFRTKLQTAAMSSQQPEAKCSDTPAQCKRRRLEDSSPPGQADDTYQKALDDLGTLAQRIEKLRENRTMPEWAVTRGKSLLQHLSVCFDQR